MRQTLIIALSLFLGCATGVAVRDIVVPARAQGSTGPSYEYQVIGVEAGFGDPKEAQVMFARFAREGWRYAGVVVNQGAHSVVAFERPRSAPPKASSGGDD